jgi:hypothetical protein
LFIAFGIIAIWNGCPYQKSIPGTAVRVRIVIDEPYFDSCPDRAQKREKAQGRGGHDGDKRGGGRYKNHEQGHGRTYREHIDASRAYRFRHGLDDSMSPSRRRSRELALLQAATFDIPPVRSKPTHQKQYDEDDQDDADETDAAVPKPVAVAAEAATEATKQEDDEDDDEYESERHNLSPVAAPNRTLSLIALRL